MRKWLIAVITAMLFIANAQAATHPTCKKFFKQMDEQIALLQHAQIADTKKKELKMQWTQRKAAMVKQTQESQARACQNGLNSLRQMK